MPSKDGVGEKMAQKYRRYRFLYKFFRVIFGFMFRIKVIGKENIPQDDGFLVCCNHFSGTDPIKIAYAMPGHKINFMAKKELFGIPVFSHLIKLMGAFPVDRSIADVGAIRKMLAYLESGESCGIFPQGTRHPGVDPRNTAIKPGAGMMVARTGATVLPVFIEQKDFKHKNFRPSTVYIGKPMKAEDFKYQPKQPGEYIRISNEIFSEVCRLGEENGCLEEKAS